MIPKQNLGRIAYLVCCVLIFAFLIAPILVIVPLSFNAEPYFTFTEGMVRLEAEAYSLRWYRQIIQDEVWTRALGNSLIIGIAATALATALGTLAALGLSSPAMPGRRFRHGTAHFPDGHAGDHLRSGHVFLFFQPGPRPNPPRIDPRPRRAGHALCRDHSHRDPPCPPLTQT